MNHNKFGELARIIYKNIDQPIILDELSLQIGMSLTSLKRLCEQAVNQSPGAFIRKLRMELAFRSLQSRENSILEIALASGYDDHSSFSRQFKETFGYSPTQAREKINIVSELECIALEEPDIVELTDLHLQSVTETGYYYDSAPKAWIKLKEKLTEQELTDDFTGIFIGIGHDNPHDGITPEDKSRFSACTSHNGRNIEAEQFLILGGKYARFRYKGKPNSVGLAYHYIFGQWADKSAIKINKSKPAFILFHSFPEATNEQDLIIHVPMN